MTTAFGWYCLRDVLVSLLLALNQPALAAFVDEGSMGVVRAPEEGELNGIKLAASGILSIYSMYEMCALVWLEGINIYCTCVFMARGGYIMYI